jgi:hypothetical protein
MPLQRTNPRLRRPAGLETAASRGPFRIHPVLDNSVTDLEAEAIHHDFSAYDHDLREAMRDCSLLELGKRYPEMTFARLHSAKRPRGYDAAVERGGKGWYLVAKWRTAA